MCNQSSIMNTCNQFTSLVRTTEDSSLLHYRWKCLSRALEGVYLFEVHIGVIITIQIITNKLHIVLYDHYLCSGGGHLGRLQRQLSVLGHRGTHTHGHIMFVFFGNKTPDNANMYISRWTLWCHNAHCSPYSPGGASYRTSGSDCDFCSNHGDGHCFQMWESSGARKSHCET